LVGVELEPLRDLPERLHALVAGALAAEVEARDLITEVRPAAEGDLAEVARIHKDRFGSDDYTLGQYSCTMIRAFYRLFVGRCVFLVHVTPTGVDGFILGGDPKELADITHSFVRLHPLRCCLETLVVPRVWPAAFRSIRKLFMSPRKALAEELSFKVARLLSIAVDKNAEGTGAATALADAFRSHICGKFEAFELKVAKSNHRAVRLYHKLGMTADVDDSLTRFRFRKTLGRPVAPGPHGP
jgi:ribosomal protein S18 acetylase RimI-like enzyme